MSCLFVFADSADEVSSGGLVDAAVSSTPERPLESTDLIQSEVSAEH